MRTAVFFGLLMISESISAQTGYTSSHHVNLFGGIILLFCIALDITEEIRK